MRAVAYARPVFVQVVRGRAVMLHVLRRVVQVSSLRAAGPKVPVVRLEVVARVVAVDDVGERRDHHAQVRLSSGASGSGGDTQKKEKYQCREIRNKSANAPSVTSALTYPCIDKAQKCLQ